jgi:hypothetical protein
MSHGFFLCPVSPPHDMKTPIFQLAGRAIPESLLQHDKTGP